MTKTTYTFLTTATERGTFSFTVYENKRQRNYPQMVCCMGERPTETDASQAAQDFIASR